MSSHRPLEATSGTRIIVLGSEGHAFARALAPWAVAVRTLSELEARLAVSAADVVLVADELSALDKAALERLTREIRPALQVWFVTPLGGFQRHATTVLQVGDLEVDASAGRVTLCGQPLELRAKLVDMLRLLSERGERGASYEDVIAAINRGYGKRSLVHQDMSQLRRALGPAAAMLWTKRDYGYALCPTRPAGFRAMRGGGETPLVPTRTRRRSRRK